MEVQHRSKSRLDNTIRLPHQNESKICDGIDLNYYVQDSLLHLQHLAIWKIINIYLFVLDEDGWVKAKAGGCGILQKRVFFSTNLSDFSWLPV